MYFQDVVATQDENTDEELSLAFFELANAKCVGFRLNAKQMARSKRTRSAAEIVVQQDVGACGQHTGGIVWETSYLLMNYLLSRREKLERVLEVGSGCGMLGLVLQASGFASKRVVLTETANVMENLLENMNRNEQVSKKALGCQLDWNHVERDAQTASSLRPHSFDTIVGTDVIFAPSLVKPLLQTLQYMSHENTVVYLCLQVRCPDSHRLFLDTASQYDWGLENISSKLASIPECAWGLQMECCLLQMTRISKEITNDSAQGGVCKKRKSRHPNDNISKHEDKKKKKRETP